MALYYGLLETCASIHHYRHRIIVILTITVTITVFISIIAIVIVIVIIINAIKVLLDLYDCLMTLSDLVG